MYVVALVTAMAIAVATEQHAFLVVGAPAYLTRSR
jgi:hypothetical protein